MSDAGPVCGSGPRDQLKREEKDWALSVLHQEIQDLGGDITTALEELTVPAWLLDADGIIRWQNGASRTALGERIGEPFTRLVAPAEVDGAHDVFTHIVCRGQPAEFTLHVHDSSGALRPVDISSAPVRSGGGVVGVFGLSRPLEKPTPSAGANRAAAMLTPRQLDVLRLLAQGASTDEIAATLHLAGTTVRNHIANILPALGVHTRLQAVLAANKAGLLDD